MLEVSFQLLWVDIFVFGIVQGLINVFPHSGCGFFLSSCCVYFHYLGCYILWVFMQSFFHVESVFVKMVVMWSSPVPM